MLKRSAVKALFIVILVSVLLATPVLAYTYRAPYVITETSSNDYEMFGAMVDANNEWMADNDFMETDTLDTRVESLGGQAKPHMVATDRTLTAVPISADSQTNLYFTTGNTDLTNTDIITGYEGLITMADDADLECAATFEDEFDDVYLLMDGGDSAFLLDKGVGIYRIFEQHSGGEIGAYIDEASDQSYTGSLDAVRAFDDTNYIAQTFTPATSGYVTSIQFHISGGLGINSASYIAIRATAAGKPTGSNLATIAFTSNLGAVNTVYFDEQTVYLAATTMYAFIVYKPTGPAGNNFSIDNTAPGYAGGTICTSGDSGSTWAIQAEDAYIFDVYLSVAEVRATGLTSDEYDIIVSADGANLELDINSGVITDSMALGGASVNDTADDWLLMYNYTTDFMTNMSYFKHTTNIGGYTLKAWYQPVDMIENTGEEGIADAGTQTTLDDAILTQANDYWNGARLIITETTDHNAPEGEVSVVTDFDAANDRLTFDTLTAVVDIGDTYTIDFATLVDRQGGDEDARLTWGYMPTGVVATLGGMVSSSQPIPGFMEDDPVSESLPTVEVSDWYVEPDVTGSLLTNPLRPFVTIMSDTTTLTELQSWRILGLAFVLFVTVLTAMAVRSHLLISGVACAASIGLCVAWTIFPFWAIIFAVGAMVGGLVAERSPSL